MQISKEMIWYMDENPNKDGTYLYAQFRSDGMLLNIATVGYTKKYGWNSSKYSGAYSWGQHPEDDGSYAWAKLPFPYHDWCI